MLTFPAKGWPHAPSALCYHAPMERITDKAIVLACCLAVAGCELSSEGAQGTQPEALALAAAMLLALTCALAREISTRPAVLAAHALYCAAACAAPEAAVFTPLVTYDLVRNAHAANPTRYLWVLAPAAFLCCALRGQLSSLGLGVLACALAAASLLSMRTNRALARATIAHATRDTMKLQAIALRNENTQLASEVQQLHEAADAARTPNAAAPDAPEPEQARPAAFACLTEREYEVARLVAEGLDNREIAATAYLSEGTVRNNISSILSKMGLKNRTQIAVAYYKGAK